MDIPQMSSILRFRFDVCEVKQILSWSWAIFFAFLEGRICFSPLHCGFARECKRSDNILSKCNRFAKNILRNLKTWNQIKNQNDIVKGARNNSIRNRTFSCLFDKNILRTIKKMISSNKPHLRYVTLRM